MSMREMIVPKSLDAQRTKAKTLWGGKLTTRRRRSRICSDVLAEPDPVFDLLLNPCQLDVSQTNHGRRRHATQVGSAVHGVPPSAGGNSRASSSRSMSATVTPRWNAAILIWRSEERRVGNE